MKRIEQISATHPVTFSFMITFLFISMLIISAILGNLWPGDAIYGQPGSILGRIISTIILLLLLSRLGWMQPAGFTTPGRFGMWMISLLLLAYAAAASMYALVGSLNLRFFDTALPALVTLFILVAAFMEEIVFRGLILQALVHAWGSTRVGVTKSILVSALFFCSVHLLDFLSGRLLYVVLLQSLEAFFLGILLGALVLIGRSIYPAVLLHSGLNLSAYLLIGGSGLEPASSSWLLLGLLMIPPAALGIYLLHARYQPVTDKQMTNDLHRLPY